MDDLVKVVKGDTQTCIVDDIVFIGSSDEDSEKQDVVIFWKEGGDLAVNEYTITPAMVEVLKMYLNKIF